MRTTTLMRVIDYFYSTGEHRSLLTDLFTLIDKFSKPVGFIIADKRPKRRANRRLLDDDDAVHCKDTDGRS